MFKNIYITLFLLFFLLSCSSLNRKGYYLNETNINDIKEGISYIDNVINILREPPYKFDDNTFLYHSYYENTYGITNTKSYNEIILLLHFDNDGYLDKKIFKNSKISEFSYNKYKEEHIKNKDNFFKDVLKGVGLEIK